MEFRMKLSDRMQVIADRVEHGEIVADVGTDHGQIPVWLFARGISPRVILSDISEGSLRKAEETAGAYQFGEGLSFRVGNGLTVLKSGEADTVIIAGMGGKLIRQILEEDPEHAKSFRKYIFQPRKGAGHLRKWLLENGFWIVREDVVREGKFLPEIITAIWPEQSREHEPLEFGQEEHDGSGFDRAESDPAEHELALGDLAEHYREELINLDGDDVRLRVPPWTGKAHGPLEDYFRLRIGQERLKLENMQRAKERDPAAESMVEDNIRYLEDLQRTAAD